MVGRKIILTVSALLVFGLSIWAYSITYATIDISPDEYQIIPLNKPTISVDWPYALGAKLENAKVFFDGRDISDEVTINQKGFTYKVDKDLPEGVHVVDAKLKYNLIYSKEIRLKWFFSTDTVAPRIVMNERDGTLASKNYNLSLDGVTEPLSTIQIGFNNKEPEVFTTNKKGLFKINVNGLKKKNQLLLEAKDRAGNITKRKFNVIVDTKPPRVKKVTPSNGSLIFTASENKLIASLEDNESGIVKAGLRINGKPAKAKYDRKKDILIYQGTFNRDAQYRAEVEAFDVAGNKVNKSWSFKVNTSKIIVDQSDFKLYYYKGNKVNSTIGVAVGMARYPTPNGNWKVVRKNSRPSWYNPRTAWSKSMPPVIPPGYRNPLGLRAMYLNASGIRIHGTSAFGSIGRRASHGCIRVKNPEIVAFFPKVEVGTPVIIRP